jgi:hypothetical protein
MLTMPWFPSTRLLPSSRLSANFPVAVASAAVPEAASCPDPRCPDSSQIYLILVTTGTCLDAGTNANVSLVISGRNACGCPISSGIISLPDETTRKSRFETGSKDLFAITLNQNFDRIENILLAHDNSGNKPAWQVANVQIFKLILGIPFTAGSFPINRWLASDECNGCTFVSAFNGIPSAGCSQGCRQISSSKLACSLPSTIIFRPGAVLTATPLKQN